MHYKIGLQNKWKLDAIKIPIFKQNNVLCIVIKVHPNELKIYHVCQPQRNFLSKEKAPANLEKDVCVYFKVKNKIVMYE